MKKMFTRQETFDMMCEGFAKQNWEPSFTVVLGRGYYCDTQCMYRSPNGHKCAVGHLIPDEEYREGLIENYPVFEVIRLCPSLQNHDSVFLSFMQSIHDDAARFNKNLKTEMQIVANNQNLEWKF